jgi:hypothetical protein
VMFVDPRLSALQASGSECLSVAWSAAATHADTKSTVVGLHYPWCRQGLLYDLARPSFTALVFGTHQACAFTKGQSARTCQVSGLFHIQHEPNPPAL